MTLEPMHEKWVVVFTGPHVLADLRAQELADAGIPTFVPDSNMKGLGYPSDVGGLMQHKHVLVPRAEEARARALVAPE